MPGVLRVQLDRKIMIRRILYLLVLCIAVVSVRAEEPETSSARKLVRYEGPEVQRFSVETRFGWQMLSTTGVTDENKTGFRGEFINLRLDARLYKGLSFSWRQRLNISGERNFWDSTDWMLLNYAPNADWKISAGKQVVAIGGYEYDRAPIDLYTNNSEFWNHIGCYQLGVSVAYNFSSNHSLLFQFSNSPFRKAIGSNNTYGFSLMWNGKCGIWETIWSVNAFQCTRDRWMNFISLGNKFTFMPKRLWLELDFVNRASSGQTFLFKDCSVMTELSGRPLKCMRLFGKYTYDINKSGTDADLCVLNGTEMHSISGGVEYEPFKKYPDVLRLFGAVGYSWGTNNNPNGVILDDQLRLNVGAKINLDLLKGLRWAIKKW